MAVAFTVGENTALDQLIQLAAAEGTLNILASGAMRPETGEALEAAMNAKYGINIDLNFAPGPSMPRVAANLVEEYAAGQTASSDLFFGTEIHQPIMYQADVIMDTYDWKELFPYIPDDSIQLGGTVIEVATTFIGVTYNTDNISEAEAPVNIRDVLGKGWDLVSTPYAAFFDEMTLIPTWGPEATYDFVRELAAGDLALMRCGEEDRIASGEFDVLVLNCGDRDVRRLMGEGAPIKHVLLEDTAIVGFRYFSIPKHSEHPNLGALLMGYLTSLEGQEILNEIGFVSSHRIEGTFKYEEFNEKAAAGMTFNLMTAEFIEPHFAELTPIRTELQAILAG
jgi:ABC-type Fe3+ transport system substrate-binding protein